MTSFRRTRASKRRNGRPASRKIVISQPVGVSASSRDSIVAKLENKDYRTAFVEATISHGLAHQIRINREKRGWSQGDLADRCGAKTKQAVISRLEDPAYGKYSLSTLHKLASAFDVALLVKFVPFSKFLIETSDKTPEGLVVRSFSEENLYLRQAVVTLTLVEETYFQVSSKALVPSEERVRAEHYLSPISDTTSVALSFLPFTRLAIDRENEHV